MIRRSVLLLAASCGKVPIHDVDAGFDLADVSWFEEEKTLFVFAQVHAEQGIGDPSVIEVTWTTDDGPVPWTALSDLTPVHVHVPVDCGPKSLCGSTSVKVDKEPRDVHLRLRYHVDGELALDAPTVFNVVGIGPPWTNRSLVVYGVFDETNTYVQWRERHQFPTIRNEEAERLGLRRQLTVTDQGFGSAPLAGGDNPYGYGAACPPEFEPASFGALETIDRARFEPEPLPRGANDATEVCARATVTDATGTFTTGAVARKNPEVRPAFPVLKSPVRDATELKFFLGPCDRVISQDHVDMQRQRLQLEGVRTTCTDDWQQPGFVDELVVLFRDAVEAERPRGNDMVLVVALNQDEAGLSEALEAALAQVVPDERERTTPRLAGAFVLDSTIHGLTLPELAPVTLWCPSTTDPTQVPDASTRSCAIAPDNPDFQLGPFTFNDLPILPSRKQFLNFIDTYSKAQAGKVETLTFRAPEFAASAEHVDLGDFGVVTFLNEERIDPDYHDAFSYCVGGDPLPVVFSSAVLKDIGSDPYACEYLGVPPDECASVASGLLPLELMPDWHETFHEESYQLGVLWEFPFLLHMEYKAVGAGAIGAFGFTVPFGIASPAEAYYGSAIWTLQELDLSKRLTQCTRFCGHPTFDSAGVFHPTDGFRDTYLDTCYRPRYPQLGDDGFPLDP